MMDADSSSHWPDSCLTSKPETYTSHVHPLHHSLMQWAIFIRGLHVEVHLYNAMTKDKNKNLLARQNYSYIFWRNLRDKIH